MHEEAGAGDADGDEAATAIGEPGLCDTEASWDQWGTTVSRRVQDADDTEDN